MLPDIKKVKNDAGLTCNDTFVSFDDIKEPGVAEIFGLTFKAPESFVNTKYLYWDNDPEFIDIKSRFNEIVSYNGLATLEFDGLKLKATFNSMSYSFDYDFEASGGGEKNPGFTIIIEKSLNETKRQLLKAVCYKISSTPETLYNVIVYDYNKEAFLPEYDCRYYGDFIISASNSYNCAMYFIKPAK